MEIIDGKKIADEIKSEIVQEVLSLKEKGKKIPHLAAVLVGDDGASQTYVASKEKDCHEVGFVSSVYKYSADIKERDLLDVIDFLNNDSDIDGFIVQLPLPKHIDTDKILHRIKPSKDVDGFHPVNIGRMVLGLPSYIPATPQGILILLEKYKIDTVGKHCVIIGRSNIVGKPLSILLSRNSYPGNCTVTVCHSRTVNLKEITLSADILISAMGQPEFITADMVKENAVVIDVGTTRVPADTPSGFKLKGDVRFDEVSRKCSYITPVPGGVGPMTRAALLINTLKASKKEIFED